MDSGIYGIFNKTNGKVYIGQSRNMLSRWQKHKSSLRRGAHHNLPLQRAWKKYGEDQFFFKRLIITEDISRLDNLEKQYVEFYGLNCYTLVAGVQITERAVAEDKKERSIPPVWIFSDGKVRIYTSAKELNRAESDIKYNRIVSGIKKYPRGFGRIGEVFYTVNQNACNLITAINEFFNTEGIPHYTLHRTTYKILSFPSKRQLCQYFYGKTAHDRLDSVIDNPKRRIKQYLVFSSLSAAKEHANHLCLENYSAKLNRYLKDTRWAVTFKDKSELYPTRNAIIRKYSLCPSSLVKLKKGKIKQHKGVITIQNLTGASKTPI